MPSHDPHHIGTIEQLTALFGTPGAASLKKEVDHIHPLYRPLIEASPFAILATSGPEGLDVSPRGDPAGFVQIEDERTLLLPERRGNNRIDSLRNLLTDPRLAVLFLVPGMGEMLRVNGTAHISVAPPLLERLAMRDKPPQCVIVMKVERAFFQCARAIQRSGLWNPAPERDQLNVPTAGAILAGLTHAQIDGEKYDRELPQRQRDTLY